MGARVAVAVVSWNTRSLLERALRSLQPAAEEGLAEVWVIDNGSVDGSREAVRERFSWVTMLEPERNLGFGRAVNLVADRTATPWIAAANADVAALPSTLETLLQIGQRLPSSGAIAPRLQLPDGSTQHSVYAFPTIGFTLLFNLGICDLSPRLADRYCLEGRWNPERLRPVDWAIGAFLLIRREAWNEVGGFAEDQWMYAEDLDLGWRLARAGWRTWYVPAARVRHESQASTRQVWGPETADRWMISTYAWLLRRRRAAIARSIAAINVVGALARWAFYGVLATFLRAERWSSRRDLMRAWVRRHRSGLRASAAREHQ